ncbi:SDR family NAD(P)-dependent oxidoreductase [Herbiconiux sp. A18JL235]|uniref:SDR family NAD(P)-dependent oxidoreductase n=1 Tax=Herbiconiux sp. A18JL235 TaxID=3152363 RepID=A0AB39BK24_9MICO
MGDETDAAEIWLVTGANRGFGRAIAEAALGAGHRVVATMRDPSTGSLEGGSAGGTLLVEELDVRDRAAASRVVSAAVERFGRLDVVVNNAGFGLVGAVEEVSEAQAREIIDTDLLGALWVTQAALPVMREQGSGHVVQISTTGAVGTMPTLGLYNAAKWALEGFTEALAAEVKGLGIRVTIVEPGALDTAWATGNMRFSEPLAAYDSLRTEVFGSPDVPWPWAAEQATAGGTAPAAAAAELLRFVADPDDRLRLLIGDDAPPQVQAALDSRLSDYRRDPRFTL